MNNYNFEITNEDGTKKSVPVNEFQTALKASEGNRKGSEAGIRMNNQKYMMIVHNPDRNSCYLGREGGGGACIAKTSQAVVVGVWHKGTAMSNGKMQNNGDCNELVEKMADFLKTSGY